MAAFLKDFTLYFFLKCLFVDKWALWKSCTSCDIDSRIKCVWYGRFVGYWILRLWSSGIWCLAILQISTYLIHCTALQCNLYWGAKPCLETCDNEFSKIFNRFKVCKSVHHCKIQINHQPDATIFQFIILRFIYSSTCFGHSPAHHQELNDCSSSLWFYLHIVVIAVLCSWLGQLSPARPPTQHWKIFASGWWFIRNI